MWCRCHQGSARNFTNLLGVCLNTRFAHSATYSSASARYKSAMHSPQFGRQSLAASGFLFGVLLSGIAWGADPIAVESDDTSVAVQVIDDRPAVVSLVVRANGFDWVGGAERATAMGLIESAEVGGVAKPLHWKWQKDADRKNRPGEKSFVFACDDPALELVSAWEGHAGPGPVEHRVTIYNRGKDQVRLPVQASLAVGMHTPAGHAIEQRWVDKGAGTPTKDGAHKKAIGPGTESLLRCWPSGRDEPRDPIPWTCVEDVQGGQGWYAGVELTARVNIELKSGPAGAGPAGMPLEFRVGMPAEEKFPFFTRVGPGESFEAPPVFIGCFQGDVDDGANRLRRWVRTNLVPPTRDERYPLRADSDGTLPQRIRIASPVGPPAIRTPPCLPPRNVPRTAGCLTIGASGSE